MRVEPCFIYINVKKHSLIEFQFRNWSRKKVKKKARTLVLLSCTGAALSSLLSNALKQPNHKRTKMEEDAFDVSLERISVLLINYMPTAVFGFMLIIGYRVFYVKKDSDDASARSNINRGRRHSAINKQAEEAGNCNCIF